MSSRPQSFRPAQSLESRPQTMRTLLSEPVQYLLALFQRPYEWQKRENDNFTRGLMELLDGEQGRIFMGYLTFQHAHPASRHRVAAMEIADGQQRMTTSCVLLLELACLALSIPDNDPSFDEAQRLGRELTGLLVFLDGPQAMECRFLTSLNDGRQYNELFARLTHLSVIRGVEKEHHEGKSSLKNASGLLGRFVRKVCVSNRRFDAVRARSLAEAVLDRLDFIQTTLGDEHDPYQVFNSLNNQGKPLSQASLVRNIVFQRMARNPKEAERLHKNAWEPLERSLGAHFQDFIYGCFLADRPQLTKSTMSSTLRNEWDAKGTTPAEIIAGMNRYVPVFLALTSPVDPLRKWEDQPWGKLTDNEAINERVGRLNRMQAPVSITAFIFRLITAYQDEKVVRSATIESLELLESLLVRRAVCGVEQTGLHAVLRNLWDETQGDPTRFRTVIAAHATVKFPDDTEFRKAVERDNLYGRKITYYVLMAYEIASLSSNSSRRRRELEVNATQDHVMPQEMTPEWRRTFHQATHGAWVHTLANLTLLSREHNAEKGQKSLPETLRLFQESDFSTTRAIATTYATWDETVLQARAVQMGDFAVRRWAR